MEIMFNCTVAFLYLILLVEAYAQLLVTLPNGQIKGEERLTFTNKTYHGYRAIPYGRSPVGDLRFQAPQPASNWTGVRQSTEDSHICFQLQSDSPREDEDCLYINVYTPVLNKSSEAKVPVLFWIYGGGLRNGAASFKGYRPDYWIDENIIVVTHNYRVGIFGFLSTGDGVIPGNNGLKDQGLALQWTYDNIHLFGGDRNRITVHGQSAGAVSSSYHLLMKKSQGLFQSVIAESGSPLNMYSFIENPKEYAIQLTQAINPNISSNVTSEEIRDFLLSLDARTIDSFSKATAIVQPAIVIEPEIASAVVTKPPYEMLESGEFYKVPVLMGICSEEALTSIRSASEARKLGHTYDADETLVVPDIFPYNGNTTKLEVSRVVKSIYLKDNDTWSNNPGRVIRHFSDQRFSRGIIKQGKLISQYSPVFFYQFSYDGVLGGFNTVIEDAERVEHAEELKYLFLDKKISDIRTADAITHKRLIRLWSNFIKYGNPTPGSDDLIQNITWSPASPKNYKYLNINVTLTVDTNPKGDYFSMWENVFETYGQRPFTTF